MQIYTSMIIADISDEGIFTTVATDKDVIRQALIEYLNEHVDNGGLDDDAEGLPGNATTEEACVAILKHVGRHVVIQENWLVRD